MLIRKLLTFLVIVLAGSSTAQDLEAPKSEASIIVNGEKVGTPILILDDIPIDNTPIYGKHTSGFDVPESEAITMLFHRASEILLLLPEWDGMVFSSAVVALQRTGASKVIFENICRRVLALRSSTVTASDAAVIGRMMNGWAKADKQVVIDTYYAMLEKLSDDSAKLIESKKSDIHSRLSSLEFDWESQSQVDPENFVNNIAVNCDKADQR